MSKKPKIVSLKEGGSPPPKKRTYNFEELAKDKVMIFEGTGAECTTVANAAAQYSFRHIGWSYQVERVLKSDGDFVLRIWRV